MTIIMTTTPPQRTPSKPFRSIGFFLFLLLLQQLNANSANGLVMTSTFSSTSRNDEGGRVLVPAQHDAGGGGGGGGKHPSTRRNDASETDVVCSIWPALRGGRSRLLQQSSDNNSTNTTTASSGNSTTASFGNSTTEAPNTNSSNSTSSVANETFSTLFAISFPGDRSLATDENVNLFATTFANTYNNRITTTTTTNRNDDSIIICDPLFRSIKSIQATANVSLPGRSNWDELRENIPIIPVRRNQRRRRAATTTSGEHQEESSTTSTTPSSSSVSDDLWESLVESHLLDIDGGDFQQEENRQLQLQQPGGGGLLGAATTTTMTTTTTTADTGRNWTVNNFDKIYILLDISGECRGCLGDGTGRLNLFDDTTTTQIRRRERQLLRDGGRGRGRELQQDSITEEENVTCPIDSIVADAETFQTSLNTKMKELKEDDMLDFGIPFQQENEGNGIDNNGFIELVDVPVVERPCVTEELPFVAVQFVKGVIFDPLYIFSVGGTETIQQVEHLFRESFNKIADELLCDSLFRTIDTVEFISYYSEDDNNNEGEGTVTIEFVVDATCRGIGCNDPGCLFEGNDGSCQDGAPQQRERQRRRAEEMVQTIAAAATATGRGQRRRTSDNEVPDFLFHETSLLLGTTNRYSPPQDRRQLQVVEDGERCFCREDRAPRPPNHDEVRDLFQVGLDKITESFVLCVADDNGQLANSCSCQNDVNCISGHCDDRSGTCQVGGLCSRCKDGSDCPSSGSCIGSVCAEADGFLSHTCHCLDHESCRSGRCKDLGLICETVCTEGEDGGSSSCVEECFGICTEKIQDTCTEPCMSSRDCESGNCGSMVCLPVNGTTTGKLPDGCYSAFGSECESGRSENKTCTASLTSPPSPQPSRSPSSKPSPQLSTQAPTTSGPTSAWPSEAPTTSGPTFSPSIAPSGWPTALPTASPTPGPTPSPTAPPTPRPTPPPMESPSAGPTQSPTASPTPVPTQSPTASPTAGPTPGPTPSPTPSPTPGPCGSAAGGAVCTMNEQPWCTSLGVCGGDPSDEADCHPDYSVSGTCVRTRCGAAFGGAVCPLAGAIYYCTPENYCDATIKTGCQVDYSFEGTCGPRTQRCGPSYGGDRCTVGTPYCSIHGWCGWGTEHKNICVSEYSWTGATCTSGYSFPTPGPTPSPTPGPTPGPTTSPTPGPTPSPTPGPTPSPMASPTPGPTSSPTPGPTPSPTPSPTPGLNAPCGSAAGGAVCTMNEQPWCTSLGVCGGDPSDEADCHPDYSVSETCVRTRCGAAFGGAVCPLAGAIYYCTPENYCDATIQTGCQADYSFEGTCGTQPVYCGPNYEGARCGITKPWCTFFDSCGSGAMAEDICLPGYSWPGVTCT